MSQRYLEDRIAYDGTLKTLSLEAYYLWTIMLAVSDDFGVVPISPPQEFLDLCGIRQEIRAEAIHLVHEIVSAKLGFMVQHQHRDFFVFNPGTFDRVQYHILNKRTQSKYLKVDKISAQEITGRSKKAQENLVVYTKKVPSRARKLQHSSLSISSSPDLRKEKRKKVITPGLAPPPGQQNGLVPIPVVTPLVCAPLETKPIGQTVPEEVVNILHRLGAATGIPGYQNISGLSWIPALHRAGQKIGYRCLYLEALKFENWFLDMVEQGKIKTTGTHNPRSRFLNTWIHGVKPQQHTAPDTETNFPEEPVADPYAGLVRTAPD